MGDGVGSVWLYLVIDGGVFFSIMEGKMYKGGKRGGGKGKRAELVFPCVCRGEKLGRDGRGMWRRERENRREGVGRREK